MLVYYLGYGLSEGRLIHVSWGKDVSTYLVTWDGEEVKEGELGRGWERGGLDPGCSGRPASKGDSCLYPGTCPVDSGRLRSAERVVR